MSGLAEADQKGKLTTLADTQSHSTITRRPVTDTLTSPRRDLLPLPHRYLQSSKASLTPNRPKPASNLLSTLSQTDAGISASSRPLARASVVAKKLAFRTALNGKLFTLPHSPVLQRQQCSGFMVVSNADWSLEILTWYGYLTMQIPRHFVVHRKFLFPRGGLYLEGGA